MSRAASLYLALRRDLSRPPARRPGEVARVPVLRTGSGKPRACQARRKNGIRCDGTNPRETPRRGWLCADCGSAWPTRVVVESVRGGKVRVPRERQMDLAADLGRLFATLPPWERRVFAAWELACLACGHRVPHHSRRWRKVEVAEHLARHYPRSVVHVTPDRVEATYEAAADRVMAAFDLIEKVYRGGDA